MIVSFLYVLLAIFGLSLLIFVHELGHYYMARRVGMRVETFSIGFGSPIYSWQRDGVKWQIGWLLFGGYVKIYGMDNDDSRNPYEIPDGFFGKRPWDRIKVAVSGPNINIVLALVIFIVLWALGGREKSFNEYTHKIGWVDPKSELYAAGVRPGDEIVAYNQIPFQSNKDNIYVQLTGAGEVEVDGIHIDYATGKRTPFNYKVNTYPNPNAVEKGIVTTGIMGSANYILYDRFRHGADNNLPEGSPMKDSGLQYGDRIFWVDGDLVFSSKQLSELLNDGKVLLTVERDGKTLLMRVPRVAVQELKMDPEFKDELADWKYEAELHGTKFHKLYVIPYNLTNNGVVEGPLKFIDNDKELEIFPKHSFAANEKSLMPNDKIVAVDGSPIKTSYDLLAKLQQHQVNIIVERSSAFNKEISWSDEDKEFDSQVNWNDLEKIAGSIGTGNTLKTSGNYYLLDPVAPKTVNDIELSTEKKALLVAEQQEQKKRIEGIEDPEKRAHALALIKSQEQQLVLGIPSIQDRRVNYNPRPLHQFANVFYEIWYTLAALVSGTLSPKWISGPIGIVQVVHDTSMVGIKEALFWLGAISLNLGIMNLLPIPVLDGGTIVLSFYEMITGKKIHPKTLEKLIIPFAAMLVVFFVFLTYQDVTRIFSRFFHG